MARHALTFATRHQYGTSSQGIPINLILSLNGRKERLVANLDTGAQYCVFNRRHGESVGLAIESGDPIEMSTATGRFRAYGHSVRVAALGLNLDISVYFAEDPGFPRNVLGRFGWLQQTRLGLIDYEGLLYVSPYEGSS